MLENEPNDVDVLLLRGLVRSWQNKYEASEKDLRCVINQTPNYTDAYLALANVYQWTERYDEALDLYHQYSLQQPQDPKPHLQRAAIYKQQNQPQKREDELQFAEQKGADPEQLESLRQTEPLPKSGYWEVRLGYNFHSLSDDLSDWHEYSTRLIREFPHGSIALEWLQHHHFSDRDDALQLDTYFDLWQEAYGNFRFQAARNTEFLAKTDYRLELFQGFAESWETSLNARVMKFSNNTVDIYGLSLGKYLGDFYLRGNIFLSPEFNNELFSYALLGRYYYTPDSFLELSGGYGEELVTVAVGPILEKRNTATLGFKLQHYFNEKIGFSLGYELFDIESTWSRHGVSSTLMYRW